MRRLLVLACLASSLSSPSHAGARRGPPVAREAELPDAVVAQLAEVAKQGTGAGQLRLLRETLVKGLAEAYKAEAARRGGQSWRAGSLEELWGWLEKQQELYPELILAIHPRDAAAEVFGVVDQLRAQFPREVARWPHLVIAYAVVWDDPRAPARTRDAVIWGEHQHNAVEPPTLEESFRFVATTQSKLTFRSEQQRWPFLVYVADSDVTVEDRQWALRQFAPQRSDLGPVYSKVPYDNEKLEGRPARIGTNPTTLPNLLKFGGVCSERAYFASRVCKTFGVPAAAVTGKNRFGEGHAWVGYFGVSSRGGRARPVFNFHGRYRIDHYYVGSLLDPQTLTRVSDRDLELLFDGAARYADYENARLLWRVAHRVEPQDEKLATRLLVASVQANCFFGPAWLDLADKVASGGIPGASGRSLLKTMLDRLERHPDLTAAALDKFLASIPEEDVDTRNDYYNRAYRLYLGRPDLQARLRLAQGAYLKQHDRASEALRLMGTTALANAEEAIHILPLAVGALDIYREKRLFTKGIAFAEALLGKVPERRQGRPSRVYAQLCEETAKFCDDAGQPERAAKWRDKAARLAS